MTRSSSSLPSAYIFCVWGYFVDVLCQVWKMSSIPSLLRGLWVIWLCQKLFLHLLVWLCAVFSSLIYGCGDCMIDFQFSGFCLFLSGLFDKFLHFNLEISTGTVQIYCLSSAVSCVLMNPSEAFFISSWCFYPSHFFLILFWFSSLPALLIWFYMFNFP
jgi:hypothetical protein